MHGAAYTSSYFPTTHRRYLITTDWERHCRPGKRAIAVEIKWHHARAIEHALARPWMRDDEATVSFLEEMHLLQACTSTHRCHIHHNGVPTESRWMKFSHGDYVMVEAFKLEPPHDTDSEGELPMPIAGIVSDDTSSWTSSSTTQESVDELHLEDTYMSDALIIYRPLGRTLRPPYLIQAMHTTHINNLVIVMQHWQDLRYQPWRIECVHPTYGADYPQSDETHIYVVVALCDLQSPLHQVVLNVVQTLDTTLQRALPLPPHVDRDDILQANRLQGFCRRPQHTCRVYKNGQLLIEGDRRTVTHGDYIRTTITNVLDEDTERNMADSFQVSAQAEGLEHLDETGLAMLDNGRNGEPNIVDNRPRPSQASSSRGPSEQLMEIDEGNAMVPDRADYWIYMATIMYVAAMMLSRQMYHPVIKGKLKRKQRRLDKAPSNGKILRTLAFTYLIVGAEALSINVREGRLSTERQFDDIEPSMMQNYIDSTLPYTYLVCREPLTGLPPPGNTKTEEKTYISLSTSMQESFLHQSRTATMDQIVARICLLLESISLSRKISAAQKDFQKKHGAIQISLSKALQICTEPRQHTGPLVERTFEQIDTVQSTCGVQRPKGTHAHIAPAIRIDPGKVPRVYLPIATSEPNDRNGLEGFEVAPDNPEYLTRIDTGVEGRQHDVFSFETDIDILNDEYGLVNSWDLPARPDPLQLTLELHPSTTEKLLHPCTAPESHDTWFIFTDGSAGKCDQGWSFAIFSGRQSEGVHGAVQLVDWGGGYTDSDPLSHTWLGAVEDSIKSGESEAIMWAILWVLQAHQTYHERKVEIYSDSLTVLNAADGTWGGRDDDSLTLRLRALYHLLWAVRHGRDLCIHHIRGHQGNYGNELVDVLANAIRKGSLESRVPNINISHWFHGTTPNIVFAWLPFDTDRRAEETLQFQRGKLCWTPLNLPKPELQWLKTSKVKRDDQHQHYTLRLRIGSYNVGSIKEKGRTALLREQAEHFGFHALGLQETRTSIDDPVQSNYARIISVAQQGIGDVSFGFQQHWHMQLQNKSAAISAGKMHRLYMLILNSFLLCTTIINYVYCFVLHMRRTVDKRRKQCKVGGRTLQNRYRDIYKIIIWSYSLMPMQIHLFTFHTLGHWDRQRGTSYERVTLHLEHFWHNSDYLRHLHIKTITMVNRSHGSATMEAKQHETITFVYQWPGWNLHFHLQYVNIWTPVWTALTIWRYN